MNKYKPVIGLEIHVELKTKNKMFCQCSADYFGKAPNTNTCPVCLGMPGALPVPNRQAVLWTIKIGQALNCTINKHTKFDRKHYFYPDLPKSYQISQYDEPIAVEGFLDISTTPSAKAETPPYKGGESKNNKALLLTKEEYPKGEVVNNVKRIRITRVHLEEDTGKLMHTGEDTLVDFNRSSVPLVEIVTEPDFDNAQDVKVFLEELHTIIRYLDVSDADMEKGSMRMEPNISLRVVENEEIRNKKEEFTLPNYKVEVKNINSFNFAKKAIEYELKRQEEILVKGQTPVQETRGYNEDKGITYSQRSKEAAHDYRYFPEPDIPTLVFEDDLLKSIKKTIPELPTAKVSRYMSDWKVKYTDAFTLTRDVKIASYYETTVTLAEKAKINTAGQTIANYLVNKKISSDLTPVEFVQKAAEMSKPIETDRGKLQQVITHVIEENSKVVADIKAGKTNAIMFLVGAVMREMRGQADAGVVRSQLEKATSS